MRSGSLRRTGPVAASAMPSPLKVSSSRAVALERRTRADLRPGQGGGGVPATTRRPRRRRQLERLRGAAHARASQPSPLKSVVGRARWSSRPTTSCRGGPPCSTAAPARRRRSARRAARATALRCDLADGIRAGRRDARRTRRRGTRAPGTGAGRSDVAAGRAARDQQRAAGLDRRGRKLARPRRPALHHAALPKEGRAIRAPEAGDDELGLALRWRRRRRGRRPRRLPSARSATAFEARSPGLRAARRRPRRRTRDRGRRGARRPSRRAAARGRARNAPSRRRGEPVRVIRVTKPGRDRNGAAPPRRWNPSHPPGRTLTLARFMAARVALVHDFLLDLRGAERVFAALCEAWPDADVFTAVYDPRGTEGRFAAPRPAHVVPPARSGRPRARSARCCRSTRTRSSRSTCATTTSSSRPRAPGRTACSSTPAPCTSATATTPSATRGRSASRRSRHATGSCGPRCACCSTAGASGTGSPPSASTATSPTRT